jgi:hypothetical protein
MNLNNYRLVFSRLRHMLVAVAETATSNRTSPIEQCRGYEVAQTERQKDACSGTRKAFARRATQVAASDSPSGPDSDLE